MAAKKGVNESMEIAIQALERIEKHEKECGDRWAEATAELRDLKRVTEDLTRLTQEHSNRWERLAWLVVGTTLTCAITLLFTMASGAI